MSEVIQKIESAVGGVSVRGWIALETVTCFCALCIVTQDTAMMKDIVLLVLGYYFGQKTPTPPRP